MMATTERLYWHAHGVIYARAGRTPVALTTRMGSFHRAEDLAVFFDELAAEQDEADTAKAHILNCALQLRVALKEARAYARQHHPVLKHWPTDTLNARAGDPELRP